MESPLYLLLAVLVLALVFVLAIILITVLISILISILIFILVIHFGFPPAFFPAAFAAILVYPDLHDLSLGLKRKLTRRPENTAAVIPPAVAFNPPMKIPGNPLVEIASFTPFARVCPNPVNGTDAPAPANSKSGS